MLLTSAGRPTLSDFGISILQGAFSSESREQALSIPWAAAEVVTGKTSGTVASEVWSLGATLYTFAAGFSPFEHPDRSQNTQSKMTARITQAKYTPIPGAQGYEHFDAVMRQSMHSDPAQRFATMRDFGEALRQLQRLYGYDVTPLDLVDSGMLPPAVSAGGPRGPVVTTVRQTSRAQQRSQQRTAAMQEDRDGVLIDRPASGLKAGIIGAVVAVAVIGGLLGAAFGFGWIG